MKKERVFYTELSYLLGVVILAFATALMTKGGFGVSMVVAPAYTVYFKVHEFLPWFTFGMAEYSIQAILLLAMVIVLRKVKLSYLFSFVSAVFYGGTLDVMRWLVGFLPVSEDMLVLRIILYIIGFLMSGFSIALLFHSYVPPVAYEFFVMELSQKFGWNLHTFKLIYDWVSCGVSILMSFLFFGFLNSEAVGIGTILCSFVNGLLIRLYTKWLDANWTFRDRFPWRKYV